MNTAINATGSEEIRTLLYNGVRMDNARIEVEWSSHSITGVKIIRVRKRTRRVRSSRSPDGRRPSNTYSRTEKVEERVEDPSFYPGEKKKARTKLTELEARLAKAASRDPEDVIPEWLL